METPQGTYVCPSWAEAHWNRQECVIHRNTEGSFTVVDHSLNGVAIFEGTEQACRNFLGEGAVTTDELQGPGI